jgi:hypothetical protein
MKDDDEHARIAAALFHDRDIEGDCAYMEQYKLYVEMLDRSSERRQQVNSFFLSINTGACAVIGYLFSEDASEQAKMFLWFTPLAGILISYFWSQLIKSYRDLSTAKFKVILQIEERLPLSLFKAEWLALREATDPKVYTPITQLEIWVPRSFVVMYLLIILLTIPWAAAVNALR